MSEERYTFITEWYDTNAGIVRQFHLYYFINDNLIEIYDLKNKRIFLKKCEYPQIQISNLYIGSILNIYSRQHKILDYADQFTRQKFSSQAAKSLLIIKPDAYLKIGNIIEQIEQNNFNINQIKMTKLSLKEAEEFYAEHKGKSFFADLTQFICSDLIVAIELVTNDCVNNLKKLVGPTNCQVARVDAPKSLRAQFGSDGVRNGLHCSENKQKASFELDFFFSEKSDIKPCAIFNNCTICLIKPHILKQRKIGQIIQVILNEGFEISAMQSFNLNRPTAEEFLEIYKGVLPEFNQIADHISSGTSIVMEIRQENVVQLFRDICGPMDPEIAKISQPSSIRAIYGIDRIRNAVHCTDLPEDGQLEVEFFFNILQKI
ncbi:nucleoside diphosphate kinase 7, putative [Ichthyophthirius multifiliis]|uniref:Nucleoside diphosphate kinase 7, putative n=1 Tax=Ichthyophthirius multifiliis TaxID=5932 RepID=G0R5S1_ICHMU|nr:nucleoside diphosphate kinase 7, putative [Ichthyophthirius multifiliis]EGR27179.1 nucleoside diphosphate kinase 7, putative [Ichthyophthirius multifiliis]|eukprot:XP_004024063.1 nucleoside diphosphate kinase 7, putative [Ichthyophthirius multifiliis]